MCCVQEILKMIHCPFVNGALFPKRQRKVDLGLKALGNFFSSLLLRNFNLLRECPFHNLLSTHAPIWPKVRCPNSPHCQESLYNGTQCSLLSFVPLVYVVSVDWPVSRRDTRHPWSQVGWRMDLSFLALLHWEVTPAWGQPWLRKPGCASNTQFTPYNCFQGNMVPAEDRQRLSLLLSFELDGTLLSWKKNGLCEAKASQK